MTYHSCIENLGECEACKNKRNHPAAGVRWLSAGMQVIPDSESEEFRDFATKVRSVADINVALLLKKHRDYGPKNIALAPGGALNGLRVRMHDKLARISHLLDSGAQPENESLADSFLDLANYALIAQLVIRGEWPHE